MGAPPRRVGLGLAVLAGLLGLLPVTAPLSYLAAASRILAAGSVSDPQVWQAFVVLAPLVLARATGVFRKAVA